MSAALTLAALALAWAGWEAAGWLVAGWGLPVAPLVQQGLLLLLFLTVIERAWARLGAKDEPHG
jgi:hypothetical protein